MNKVNEKKENDNLPILKKPRKKDEFIIPTKDNYRILLSTNYTIKQLKEIAAPIRLK